MLEQTKANKRVARNATFLYLRMFFALLINLVTARLLLNALGVMDYGVYNIVAGFVSLFGFLNATLSSSVQRFYNYEGTKNGKEGFRDIYVTSLLSHLVIAFFVLLFLELLGLWYVNNVMVVPDNRLFAANVLFHTTVVSMLLMIIQIPYSGAVMAKERMDYYAIISIIDVILKLLIAIAVMYSSSDKLILYGILLTCVSLFDLSAYIVFCNKKFEEITFRWRIDRAVLKKLFVFSGWNLIGTFAFMLKGQGINLLLNYFFGPVINAAQGLSTQLSGAVNSFSLSIYTAFGPQVVNNYADGNYSHTKKIMFTESKVCFSLIALIITPAIFEMPSLLRLWLGDSVPGHTVLFTTLTLIDTLICTLNTPCTQVIQATGNIKKYQIGSTVINLSLIPFSFFVLSGGQIPEMAFVAIILFSCINQMSCLYFVNKEFHIGIVEYFKNIISRCVITVALIPIAPLVVFYLMPPSLLRVVLLGLSSMVYGIFIIYTVMFDNQEKIFISNIVRSKLNIK